MFSVFPDYTSLTGCCESQMRYSPGEHWRTGVRGKDKDHCWASCPLVTWFLATPWTQGPEYNLFYSFLTSWPHILDLDISELTSSQHKGGSTKKAEGGILWRDPLALLLSSDLPCWLLFIKFYWKAGIVTPISYMLLKPTFILQSQSLRIVPETTPPTKAIWS